ncbi:MAG: thiamine pyrophosphate-dependent enzyme [Acidimicrobiia bacterium]
MNTSAEQRGPTDEQLVGMLQTMIAARIYSTRCFNLQRQGRLGTMAPIDGNEATVVGCTYALDPAHDWVFSQYREFYGLGRYGDEVIRRQVLYLAGHPEGSFYPPGVNVFPAQISLAAQIPHAVGMAWGQLRQGLPGCSVAFFGDGASSEGDFYEAANFAAVIKAPVIFMLVNNGWAISTPTARQTAAATFADKAAAFGMPGVRVDGRDPVAVWEVVHAARARAVAGDGPTLVEAVTYRLGHHTTADDPTRYIPAEDMAAARAKDPVVTFAAQLRDVGLWDDERQAAAEATAQATIDAAVDAALSTPLAPDAFFDNVFAETTPRMERQRALLLELEGKGWS